MNIRHCLIPALALAWSASAAAQASTGFYAGVHGGGNDLGNWPATVSFGGPARAAGRLALDGGTQAGVMAGHAWGPNRIELEWQRGRFKVAGATLGAVSGAASGGGHFDMVTVGAYRHLELTPGLEAFGGLAVGRASVSMPATGLTGCACFASASSHGTLVQARVGLEFSLQPGRAAFVHFSRVRLPGAQGGTAPSVSYERHVAGTFGLGYRHSF